MVNIIHAIIASEFAKDNNSGSSHEIFAPLDDNFKSMRTFRFR